MNIYKMKKCGVSIIVSLIVSSNAWSQYTFNDPVSGRVFSAEKISGVRGTPFLFEDWVKGVAYTSGNVAFKDLELRLDINDNALYYNTSGNAYQFADQIKEFILMLNPADSASYLYFKNGFSGGGVNSKDYLQILVSGEITLLKQERKIVSEVNQINEGVVKIFTKTLKYYVGYNNINIIEPLKLGKKELLIVLRDKRNEIETFVNKNNLSVKKERDLVRIFDYYNSLK